MLLQPPLGGLCRVTRRLVLLQFPPILFVLKQLLRSRQQRLLQNVLVCVCVESTFIQYQFSFSLGAESSPCIHRQPQPLHLLPRNLTHRFGPNKVMSRVASCELFERMFITKHYFAPVLLGVGLSEPQSPQSAPHSSKVSVSALHPPHHRVSQSRCISISSASRIDGRIQSCDKSQESSSRLCAGKLLRLDLRAVCATCVPAVKNRKNPVPTKTQNLERGACWLVQTSLVCQELGSFREAPLKQ